jgi:N-acetylneuraminate lyase
MPEITQYYIDIAELAKIPLFLYNIPQMAGFVFTTENTRQIFSHPGIVGMKNTCSDLYQMQRMIALYPNKIFINGYDELLLPSMAIGSRCAVGSNVNIMPRKFLELRDAFLRGNTGRARELQDQINSVCECLSKVGVFRGIKGILKLQGFPCGNCRKPFSELREEEWEVLRKLLPML